MLLGFEHPMASSVSAIGQRLVPWATDHRRAASGGFVTPTRDPRGLLRPPAGPTGLQLLVIFGAGYGDRTRNIQLGKLLNGQIGC